MRDTIFFQSEIFYERIIIMSKVKVGVFGAGRGKVAIRQLMNSGDAELVAICDKFRQALDSCRAAAEEQGITNIAYYENFEDFFNHDMDAVILANYAHEHATYGARLLRSGRHIMTECLTMANMAQAVDLIEAVEESGKIYAYAENYCYTPVRWEMRNIYRSGAIGELIYAEGEYRHDCSSIWPSITYGQRNHWRNQNSPVFYCTHSIGPILYMTGLRPVKVSAFATQNAQYMRDLGLNSATNGIEIVTLENGAVLKSMHGHAKHYRGSNYELNCTLGSVADLGDGNIGCYVEKPGENCKGERRLYKPEPPIAGSESSGHGGADFYTTHYFIRSILGDDVARERIIDVYQAVDMCMPGTIGYRSIVNGNCSIRLPDLRNKEEREAYRYDTFCTFRESAGAMYCPSDLVRTDPIPDEVYDEVKRRWENHLPG